MGLISRRRDGLTRRLMTTRRFAEYFGAPDVESTKVRAWFRKQASDAGMTGAELAASLSGGQATIMEYGPSDEEESDSTSIPYRFQCLLHRSHRYPLSA